MEAVFALFQSHWRIIAIASGPLTASMIARLIFGKNRVMLMCVRGSAAWMAMQVLLAPFLQLAKSNIGYLVEITSK